MLDRLRELEEELERIEERLADPALASDPRRLAAEGARYKELRPLVEGVRRLRALHADLEAARELLSEASAEERRALKAEEERLSAEIERMERELREMLVPKDPNAGKNVIVEIRGAEGGEEANLFARDLFEMYRAYAQRRGWQMEMLDAHPSDLGGFDSVSFVLKGPDAWTRMKFEGGPHRVQRVPETESQGRIHTSSATVSVLPEVDEVEVEIDPDDLVVETFRASGPGGQHVNTTDSAVRITHVPTGVVVSVQDEKSQRQNREKAMRILRARLYELQRRRLEEEASDLKRSQVKGGGRGEKIRTYNFKENRVTDHRVGVTLYRLDEILRGDLDPLVDALLEDERLRQLGSEGERGPDCAPTGA
ncbi:MAG: peptide chain release factor 1 [Acidimicrobiales bacterium]|nr:MAG: peptide chain release factor 1 [Acidimicrobiales bacterium]